MKNTLRYIYLILVLCTFGSCTLREDFEPVAGNDKNSAVEFVARPTTFSQCRISTKATTDEIDQIENKIYTAYFLLFDNKGDLFRYTNLTEQIDYTSNQYGSIPSLSVPTDRGLSNATVCFLANMPEDYVKTLQTVEDLYNKHLAITYAPLVDCIGLPQLTYNDITVNSIPMFGMIECDLSALSVSNSSKVISINLKRLFARIELFANVSITSDPGVTTKPQFNLVNYTVENMPKYIRLAPPAAESEETPYAPPTINGTTIEPVPGNYKLEDITLSNFNLNAGDGSPIVANNPNYPINKNQLSKSLFFYAPEHIVIPDVEYSGSTDDAPNKKPGRVSGNKKPLLLTLKGLLIGKDGNENGATFKIFLGKNDADDFSIERNTIITNTIVIKGVEEIDDRVTVDQGLITVEFFRATSLDSHYEVRPLRVKDTPTDDKTATGKVTVKILNAYDENGEVPSWVRIERPVWNSLTEAEKANYCGGTEVPTKRKYFVSNLVQADEAGNAGILGATQIEFNITDDPNGQSPVWVYVDEYGPTDNTFSDATRQARIRVLFTPSDNSSPITRDYVITQRSVFPVESENREVTNLLGQSQGKFVYGIEYFEEYLYNYDRDIEQETHEGMPWGLDGVTLSRNYQSIYFNDVTISQTPMTWTPNVPDSKYIMRGASTLKNLKSTVDGSLVNQEAMLSLLNKQIADISPFYDFYVGENQAFSNNVDIREYEGYEMNVEIIHTLLESNNSETLLNQFTLDKSDPLSVIAYCYNKNKRDANGNVVTINADGSLNTSNFHWYAPSIDELNDITLSAYNKYDDFDEIFNDYFYWSCQPSYSLNLAELINTINVQANEKYYSSLLNGLLGRDEGTVSISAKAIASGSGPFLLEKSNRARAAKVSNGENAPSGVNSTSHKYKFTSIGNLTNFGSDIISQIQGLMNPTDWTTTTETVTPEANIDFESFPGNQPRTAENRVRCIYNPDPPTSATRNNASDGKFSYTYR